MSELSFYFLAFWTLHLHAVFVMPIRRKWIDTLPTFVEELQLDVHVHALVVDYNNTGDVFVGGHNFVHHLSSDLELKQSVSVGPLKDYPGCSIPPYPCHRTRVSTDNVIMLMKLVYYFEDTPSLLLCGTVYNRLCQVRPINNLQEFHWVHPFNDTLGTGSNFSSALFEPGYDGQLSLFTASHDISETRNQQPFLSSRKLKKDGDRYYFQYSFENGTNRSSMRITGRSTRLVMDNGFVHGNYIYFPILYEYPGFFTNTIENRLVRVCTKDPTFKSYAELQIICNSIGKANRITAAHLGVSRNSNGKALYAFFQDKSSGGSALCVFEMSSIVEAFSTSRRPNADQCTEEFVGGTREHKESLDVVDVVSQPLKVSSPRFVQKYFITTMTVVKQYDDVVVIAGSSVGTVLKISMNTGDLISVKEILDGRTKIYYGSPFVADKEYKHIYIAIYDKVIKYPIASCGAHETCQECFTSGKTDPLKCGWCGGRCAHLEECADPKSFSVDTCTPTIYEVFPQKGPIQGANSIKITGDGFGSYVDDEHNYILVAGIPCKVSSWNNTQVNCFLGSTTEELSGLVQLKVDNTFSSNLGYTAKGSTTSQSTFSYYVGPRIYGLRPSKGPTSGGTDVTLFGLELNFDKDKNRSITVNGRHCTLKRFDANTVSCITGNISSKNFPNQTAIHIDGIAYVMDELPPENFNLTGLSQSFEYTPDPFISNIRPGITTISGLMNLTVTGLYLDSVRFPKVVVKVTDTQIIGDSEFVEECWTDPKSNGSTMTCRTPSLKSRIIVPTPTRTHPLVVQVSFIMDGVQQLRDFPKHRGDLARLLYYPDPVFKAFQDTQKVKKDQRMLEIKIYEGMNLDLMHLADSLQVRIGKDEFCEITKVLSDILFCDLPSSILSNSTLSGTNMPVEVITGSTIHHLGYIQIDRQKEDNVLWISLFAIALILISLCVIFVSYKCFVRRRRKPVHNINIVEDSTNDMVSCVQHPLNPPTVQHPVRYRAVPTESSSEDRVVVANLSYLEHSAQDAVAESPGSDIPFVDNDTLLLLENKNLIISKRFLVIGEKIGTGQFGCVFEGYLMHPNQTETTKVAIKTLREHSWNEPETVHTFLKEALIMRNFEHPNVLSLLGVCFEGTGPSIVLPFMENKDLHSYIVEETRTLCILDLLKFAVDVAAGMLYLEEKECIHRDLAARNCVLDSHLNAKVADFGLSRKMYMKNYYSMVSRGKIPYKWTAPESLAQLIYTTKTDVWSYGILLWELMTRGSTPYSHVDNFDLLKFLNEGKRLDLPEKCPVPLYRVMLACWNMDPSTRPSFYELHDCVSKIRDIIQNSRQDKPESSVPAQNTVYYNSEKLYLSTEEHTLNENIFEEDF